MALVNNKPIGKYIQVGSEGDLRLVVTETTLGAIRREYETSTGVKGVKWELIFTDLSGMITAVNFKEGEFGTSLQVTVKDGEDEPIILSVGTDTGFGEDLMKKFPNIDVTKPVRIAPYCVEKDSGKKIRGMTVYQDDKRKILGFYYDPEAKKTINGLPEPKGDTKKYSKDKWKAYFLDVRLFLMDEVSKQFKLGENAGTGDAAFGKF